MQEDGFAGGGGDPHLGAEGGLLGGDVGVVEVVVVEADLADGDAPWICGEFGQFGEGFGGGLVGLLRVDAGAGPDGGVLVGEGEGTVHGGGAVADADGEDLADAGGVGGGDDGGGVVEEVEVSVGVDEHG